MRTKKLKEAMILGLLFFTLNIFSQEFKGKIHTDLGTPQDIEIRNYKTEKMIFSNLHGDFRIEAGAKDTLSFSSPFYQTKTVVIDSTSLNKNNTVYLKHKIIALDEVAIHREKHPFDVEELQANSEEQFKSDYEKHPYLYKSQKQIENEYYFNFLGVGKLLVDNVGQLIFPKKDKEEPKITYKDLKDLFSDDDFFTEQLLEEELQIPEEKKYLFFSYCENRLSTALLKPDNNFLLLNELMELSEKFRDR